MPWFTKVKAREVMVPRAEVVALEKEKSIDELKALFASTGFSKIPIYDDTIDDIIGFVHAFEMLKQPKSIREILLPVEFVHEPNPINEVLNRLTRKRKSIAIVLDEYGGTAGLLTLEDILKNSLVKLKTNMIKSIILKKIERGTMLFLLV